MQVRKMLQTGMALWTNQSLFTMNRQSKTALDPSSFDLPSFYKHSITFFRALHSLARLIPGFSLHQRLQENDKFSLCYRIGRGMCSYLHDELPPGKQYSLCIFSFILLNQPVHLRLASIGGRSSVTVNCLQVLWRIVSHRVKPMHYLCSYNVSLTLLFRSLQLKVQYRAPLRTNDIHRMDTPRKIIPAPRCFFDVDHHSQQQPTTLCRSQSSPILHEQHDLPPKRGSPGTLLKDESSFSFSPFKSPSLSSIPQNSQQHQQQQQQTSALNCKS